VANIGFRNEILDFRSDIEQQLHDDAIFAIQLALIA